MTERAQPGAVKSLVRNDELAQILGQLTGRFDDGWVADPADPTPASTRRNDIDESAFDGFALSNVSASSVSVDVGPGEGFAGGWVAIDTTTTVTVPANSTSTIVAAMDLDAIYDPQNDPDRDAADRVVVDIEANVSDDLPRVQLHDVTTDGSGVTGTTDLRKPYGPALEAASGTVEALEATKSINKADLENASQDEIIKKSASGADLKFEEDLAEPNIPDFAEDDNSPFSTTGNPTTTIQLANSFDLIRVQAEVTNSSNRSQWLAFRLNGVAGGAYTLRRVDGSSLSSTDEIYIDGTTQRDSAGDTHHIEFDIIDHNGPVVTGPFGSGFSNTVVSVGVSGVSYPVDSIEFVGERDEITVNCNVYGRNI